MKVIVLAYKSHLQISLNMRQPVLRRLHFVYSTHTHFALQLCHVWLIIIETVFKTHLPHLEILHLNIFFYSFALALLNTNRSLSQPFDPLKSKAKVHDLFCFNLFLGKDECG